MEASKTITISKKGIIFTLLAFFLISCDKTVEEEVREVRTKEYRSITIINKTGEKLITECILTTKSGVIVARQEKTTENNIVIADFDSIGAFKDERDFKVTLVGRYGFKYEKIFKVGEKGNTDITIESKDVISQNGDWFRKVKRFFNKG